MVHKGSSLTCDNIVKLLTGNEIGIVLVEDDKEGLPIMWQQANIHFNDKQSMYGSGMILSYHVFPLFYKQDPPPHTELIRARASAVHNIFLRWTAAGYNIRGAKDPFKSKLFMKYLKDIGYTTADYMLLHVEN